jgi:hypothetical protein
VRFAICLKYLATGDTPLSIGDLFGVGTTIV